MKKKSNFLLYFGGAALSLALAMPFGIQKMYSGEALFEGLEAISSTSENLTLTGYQETTGFLDGEATSKWLIHGIPATMRHEISHSVFGGNIKTAFVDFKPIESSLPHADKYSAIKAVTYYSLFLDESRTLISITDFESNDFLIKGGMATINLDEKHVTGSGSLNDLHYYENGVKTSLKGFGFKYVTNLSDTSDSEIVAQVDDIDVLAKVDNSYINLSQPHLEMKSKRTGKNTFVEVNLNAQKIDLGQKDLASISVKNYVTDLSYTLPSEALSILANDSAENDDSFKAALLSGTSEMVLNRLNASIFVMGNDFEISGNGKGALAPPADVSSIKNDEDLIPYLSGQLTLDINQALLMGLGFPVGGEKSKRSNENVVVNFEFKNSSLFFNGQKI